MRHLDPPSFTPRDTYLTCISTARPATRTHLAAFEDAVAEAGEQFHQAAQAHTLHDLTALAAAPAAPADREALRKVYTSHLVGQGTPGRHIYDAIKNAARGLCPLCGVGKVATLDHQLPKTSYPLLSVVPANLVPACRDCNFGKGQQAPASAGEQTLHPYYDDLFDVPWLAARLIRPAGRRPMSVRFHVEAPADWDQDLVDRLRSHLKVFDLDARFRLHVGSHLATLAGMLSFLPSTGIEQYLTWQAQAWTKTGPNSWEAALYRALATDPWYTGGGWRHTGDEPQTDAADDDADPAPAATEDDQ
ncbi:MULTISPECIES: hypothetical protein [Kitasatospora]|uniref:HNH endonuclease n=1 Tax=Kitasatospora TaxID=2063 RepID=UPI0033D48AAD